MKSPIFTAAIGLTFVIAAQMGLSVASTADQRRAAKAVPVQSGTWGGPDVEIQVGKHGATLEFDCANGSISEALLLDTQSKFQANGTFQGPIGLARKQEPVSGISVLYTGIVEGRTMKLEFVLPENQRQGPFTLVRGQQGRLQKCQ